MATLNLTFKLYDAYARTADKVINKTDQATNEILKASGITDKFNTNLEAVGANASSASRGLGKFLSIKDLLAGAIKGMNFADEYTNTSSRLGLITDSLKEQEELQNKIFAAADRSRSSFTSMAGAISTMGIAASNAFSSNGELNTDELVAFTELIQKGIKLGGASSAEQSSTMLQLTQSMGEGKLQGDGFQSLLDNAPILAEAIASYTNKSKGELKAMSAEGLITSDIIKNAIIDMSDEINTKFEETPITFADIWNKITNGASKAFDPFIKRVGKILKSDKFKNLMDKVEVGLNKAAEAADKALDVMGNIYDFVSANWPLITDLILAAAAAWGVYQIALLAVQIAQWAANFAAFINPVGIAIIIILVLAAAFVLLWENSENFRKLWVKCWKSSNNITVWFYNNFARNFNQFTTGWNVIIEVIQSFVTALKTGMTAAVQITSVAICGLISLFGGLIDTIGKAIDAYNVVAELSGMDTIDFNISTDNMKDSVMQSSKDAIKSIDDAYGGIENLLEGLKVDKKMKFIDPDKVKAFTNSLGDKLEDFTITGWLKNLFDEGKKALDNSLPDDKDDPTTVEGTGPNGEIPVNMSDEDIMYLRDIAEREYVNKFSSATLAPNITFTFGDIHEEADVDKVKSRLETIMREEIAMTAEGAY